MRAARRVMWGGLVAALVLGWAAILGGGVLWGLGFLMGFVNGMAVVGSAVYLARLAGWR